MTQTIAFIGLGMMGHGMARNLLAKGFALRFAAHRNRANLQDLLDAGAKEVHVAVSCPPHQFPCVYGIDFPDRSKLMAANNTVDEIRKYLNADSLHYLSQEGMVKATGQPASAFCMACYDGKYPVPYDPALDKSIIERRRRNNQTLGETAAQENTQISLLKG